MANARNTPKVTDVATQPMPKEAGTEVSLRDTYTIMQPGAAELVSEVLAMNAGGQLTQFDFDRVGVPPAGGRQWIVPALEGDEPMEVLEGVVVHWKDTRAYWESSYTGASNPPDCSSPDNEVGQGLYGKGSPGNPTGLCSECPMSQYGTAVNDKGEQTNGQACKQVRVLFMVRPGEALPLVVALPPTSVKPMRQFLLRLAGKVIPYYGITMRLGLEQDKNSGGITYSKVKPGLGEYLSREDADAARVYGDEIRRSTENLVIIDEGLLNGEQANARSEETRAAGGATASA